MAALRFVSPERRWRAALMALPAAWFGWRVFLIAGPVAACAVGAALLALELPVMRTCLIVSDDGLVDRRALRVVRVSWQRLSGFRIDRPGGWWGGFCVVAICRDGTVIDLLSTRVYTRLPSSGHLDDLHRICWTLQDRMNSRGPDLPHDP